MTNRARIQIGFLGISFLLSASAPLLRLSAQLSPQQGSNPQALTDAQVKQAISDGIAQKEIPGLSVSDGSISSALRHATFGFGHGEGAVTSVIVYILPPKYWIEYKAYMANSKHRAYTLAEVTPEDRATGIVHVEVDTSTIEWNRVTSNDESTSEGRPVKMPSVGSVFLRSANNKIEVQPSEIKPQGSADYPKQQVLAVFRLADLAKVQAPSSGKEFRVLVAGYQGDGKDFSRDFKIKKKDLKYLE